MHVAAAVAAGVAAPGPSRWVPGQGQEPGSQLSLALVPAEPGCQGLRPPTGRQPPPGSPQQPPSPGSRARAWISAPRSSVRHSTDPTRHRHQRGQSPPCHQEAPRPAAPLPPGTGHCKEEAGGQLRASASHAAPSSPNLPCCGRPWKCPLQCGSRLCLVDHGCQQLLLELLGCQGSCRAQGALQLLRLRARGRHHLLLLAGRARSRAYASPPAARPCLCLQGPRFRLSAILVVGCIAVAWTHPIFIADNRLKSALLCRSFASSTTFSCYCWWRGWSWRRR